MRRHLAVLVLPLLLAGCGIWGMEGGPGGAGGLTPTPSATVPAATASVGADGVQRVDIRVGDDLRFTPAQVQATVGTIEFVFHNDGLTPHDVRIAAGAAAAPALGTSGNINGGETVTVRVTIDRPGTYPFPCVYHSTSGMQGTLEIRS